MSDELLLGRRLPGTAGETRRTVHLFPRPRNYPGNMRALCGEVIYSADLEWLDGPTGAPCELCMLRSPGPADESSWRDERQVVVPTPLSELCG